MGVVVGVSRYLDTGVTPGGGLGRGGWVGSTYTGVIPAGRPI